MGEGNVTTIISTPTTNYTKTVNIEAKLKEWRHLEQRRQFLEREIPKQTERLFEQKDRMSRDGIMSSISQKYTDMPRGNEVSDKVGDLVASTLEKIYEQEIRIHDMRAELAEIYAQLADIEFVVYQVKPSYQPILTRYFRDGMTQSEVADSVSYSQQRVEQVIRKCVRSFKRPLA